MSLRELVKKANIKAKKGRILTSNESKRIRSYGHRAERALVKKLRENGFKAVRIPVSASSSEPLPDVFATKGKCLYAFEVKATSADKAYFDHVQIEKLFLFLAMFEAYEKKIAVLACKFPYKWVVKSVSEKNDYVVSAEEKSTFIFT
ncbi:MAG: Holliday junction resolvase Hjc [Candidatus Bathyarchaeia archaeon]